MTGAAPSSAGAAGSSALAAFGLIVISTTIALAGTDLVLPAVPSLPEVLGGDAARAQLVLAAFVAGTAGGLMAFGSLGARFDQRHLLVGSLLAYAGLSALAAFATSLDELIALRLGQGFVGAAPAVFAPGMIRAVFDPAAAMRAIGVLGSIESIVPALAPVAGVWLLHGYGWQGSFVVLALVAAVAALALWGLRHRLPRVRTTRSDGSYLRLLRDPTYLRYALSHACTLGALLIFVFGAPTVITRSLGGTLGDFIVLQICGISFFIVAANVSGHLTGRFGTERIIHLGTWVSALGIGSLLIYGLTGGKDPRVLAALFVPLNLGLGLRGPAGFYQAVAASRGDDARGAALLVLAALGVTAIGTAVAAGFITEGLVPLAAIATGVSLLSLALLKALPAMEDPH